MAYDRLTPPSGSAIEYERAFRVAAPDRPVIPFIEGDGIGPDIWAAARRVFDTAVEVAYGGQRVEWFEIYAGEKAVSKYGAGSYLPDDTLTAIRDWRVAIKGPLTTPVGGGIRSLNVTLRQELDLYCCIRPCRWYEGTPPVKEPGKVDIVVFRENTEDVYAGIEWKVGRPSRAGCGDSSTRRWERTFRRLRHRGQADERAQHETARRGLDPVCPRQERRSVTSSTRATS